MNEQHHNIPTVYNGVNFRSRLEAKYAAMFDQLGWKWEYEPIDLKGWIPDFVIKAIKPIFVEVKPVWDLDEVKILGREIVTALGLKESYVDGDNFYPGDSWGEGEMAALICGAHLLENIFGVSGLGWLWDDCWSASYVYKRGKGGHGLCHDTNSYKDRITGEWDGDDHLGPPAELEEMWRQAVNLVQWRGRGA